MFSDDDDDCFAALAGGLQEAREILEKECKNVDTRAAKDALKVFAPGMAGLEGYNANARRWTMLKPSIIGGRPAAVVRRSLETL